MVDIVLVTREALLIARPAYTQTVAEYLNGRSPVCVAVDTRNPMRLCTAELPVPVYSEATTAATHASCSVDRSRCERPESVFVAIEAGALVRTFDGGRNLA